MTPSDPLLATRHFPGVPVINKLVPDLRRIRAKEGLSGSHDNFWYVPLPLRRRVLRHPLQNPRCLPWPSPNTHKLGSLHFLFSQKPLRRCRIRFMRRSAHRIHLTSNQASLPKPKVLLPRTLASPWTGLTPASYRELVARLRHFSLLGVMTPELLDARGSRFRPASRATRMPARGWSLARAAS